MLHVKNTEEDESHCEQRGREQDETESVGYKSCQHPVTLYLLHVFCPNMLLLVNSSLLPQKISDVYQNWIRQDRRLCQLWFDMVAKALVEDVFLIVPFHVVIIARVWFMFLHEPQQRRKPLTDDSFHLSQTIQTTPVNSSRYILPFVGHSPHSLGNIDAFPSLPGEY